MKKEHREYIHKHADTKSPREIARDLGIRERRVKKVLDSISREFDTSGIFLEEKPAEPEMVSSPSSFLRSNKLFVVICLVIIAVLGSVVFLNTLNGEFIMDDVFLIRDNPYIKNLENISDIFTKDQGRGEVESTYYRPLQSLVYAINYHFWGLKVQPYHAANIIIHILSGMCVFWMICLLFDNIATALLSAILFIVHPIQSETVGYISATGDCLVGFFTLLTFILYVRNLDRPSFLRSSGLVCSFVMALLSKENSLILPALFILYHIAFNRKFKSGIFGVLSLITLVFFIFRVSLLNFGDGPSALSLSSILSRVPGSFAAIAGYMRILVAPFNLYMGDDAMLFPVNDPRVIAGFLLTFFILGYAILERKGKPLFFFGVAWFFITFLPVSGLFPIVFHMADHYLYLPSIGFFLILSTILLTPGRKGAHRIYLLGVVLSLVVFSSYLTVQQNKIWMTPKALFTKTLEYDPENPRMLNNMANVLHEEGREKEAVKLYEKAMSKGHNKALLNYNLGNSMKTMGKTEEAIAAYKRAIFLKPEYPQALNNLGLVYFESGRIDESIKSYKKAIKIRQDFAGAYYNLGNSYNIKGDEKDAVAMYRKAIELDPDYKEVYNNLSTIYIKNGQFEDAIALLEKAIEIDPGYVDAYNNLGVLYQYQKDIERSVEVFKKATRVDPASAKAYNNWGNSMLMQEKFDDAEKLYKKALEIDPAYGKAYENLSILFYKTKRFELSREYCDKAGKVGYKVKKGLLDALKNAGH